MNVDKVKRDIKPRFPHPFNRQELACSLAIAGTVGWDVTTIDPFTITLIGVVTAPWDYYNGTSAVCGTASCGCMALIADGRPDLNHPLSSPAVTKSLEPSVRVMHTVSLLLWENRANGNPIGGSVSSKIAK